MQVLVVEDNARIARFVRQGLEEEGSSVHVCDNGTAGLEALLTSQARPDVCILDVMLPDLSGFDVLQRARDAGCTVPILLLTARGGLEDRVHGLDLGADDYLAKPFEFQELLARLRALHRRANQSNLEVLRVHDVVIDLRTRKATRRSRHLHLSPREFSLLQYMAEHIGCDLPRSDIWRQVFDLNINPSTNIVDVYVGYLRKKLGDPPLIRTVRGVGYRMEAGP